MQATNSQYDPAPHPVINTNPATTSCIITSVKSAINKLSNYPNFAYSTTAISIVITEIFLFKCSNIQSKNMNNQAFWKALFIAYPILAASTVTATYYGTETAVNYIFKRLMPKD